MTGWESCNLRVIPKEEVLSLEDEEHRTLLITDFTLELVHFPEYSDPAWTTKIPARTFRALRIHITEENRSPMDRWYWIDSKRLIGLLFPLLNQDPFIPRRYLIRKHGIPPKSFYEVSVT